MNKIKLIALGALLAAGSSFSETLLWKTGDGPAKLRTGGYGYGVNEDAQKLLTGTYTCGGDTFGGGGTTYSFKSTDMPKCEDADGNVEMGFHIVSNLDPASTGDGWSFGFGAIGYDLVATPDGQKTKDTYNASAVGASSVLATVSQTGCEDGTFSLVLNTGGNVGYAGMVGDLSTSATGEQTIDFEDFVPDYSNPTLDPSAIEAIQIKCKLTEDTEQDVTIKIMKLAFDGGVATKAELAAPSVKLALSGKSLSFKTSATLNVEVFDLQGRLVANGAVSKDQASLSLSSLSQGSYVVRATGADVNMMQKIVIAD